MDLQGREAVVDGELEQLGQGDVLGFRPGLGRRDLSAGPSASLTSGSPRRRHDLADARSRAGKVVSCRGFLAYGTALERG